MNQPYLIPENRKYRFRCKVVSKRVNYEDVQGKGKPFEIRMNAEAEVVFLIPDDSSQADSFFAAWLPDSDTEHTEVLLSMPRPVYGMCRVAVRRASNWMPRPHLQVMSLGAESRLVALIREKKFKFLPLTIDVESQPSEAEEDLPEPE